MTRLCPYTGCHPLVGQPILTQRMDRSGVHCHDFLWKNDFGAAQGVSYSFDLTFGGKPISFCGHSAIRHLTDLRGQACDLPPSPFMTCSYPA